MSFFGNLVEVVGGAGGGFAQGMRQVREKELAQQQQEMERFNIESMAVDRHMRRAAEQQRHRENLEFDQAESLRRREEAAGRIIGAGAAQGYNVTFPEDPSMPFVPRFDPMTEEQMSPSLRAALEADRARAGMLEAQDGYYERDRPSASSTPRYNQAEAARAQSILQRVVAEFRDDPDGGLQRARQIYDTLRQGGQLGPSVSENGLWLAISDGLADHYTTRREMSPMDLYEEQIGEQLIQPTRPGVVVPDTSGSGNPYEDERRRRGRGG